MLALIWPFSWSFDEQWLVYLVPLFLEKSIKIWQIVEVPLRNSIIYWVVFSLDKKSNIENNSKIKSIISIWNDNIFLNQKQIDLILFMSKFYFTFIHNVINLFFPKNLLTKIKKQKLIFVDKEDFIYNYNNDKKLTLKQKEIYKHIKKSNNNKFLFFWITWSWKTEIYVNLIHHYIKHNKQVLFLIPEIILNKQLYSRLEKVFWKQIIIINSSITEATKTKNRLNIINNNAKVVIWTRSSLFYPYNNLWLIIVDEEHDNSYISDSSPRYNTLDIVNKITDLNKNKLLLASWTPSINSMYKALKWDYELLNLTEKYK